MKPEKAFFRESGNDGSGRGNPDGRGCRCSPDPSDPYDRSPCCCKIELAHPWYNWQANMWIRHVY